ncbi:hypothetical protein XENOCAPTIV_019373, partial [Xenoophorus captivus]
VDGFFTLVFGLSSIYTLMVISITRYIKGCHPNRGLIPREPVFLHSYQGPEPPALSVLFQLITLPEVLFSSSCSSSGSLLGSGLEPHCSAGAATQVGIQVQIQIHSMSSNFTLQLCGCCTADRGYGTCEIDWSKASYSSTYRSYIIAIFVFCFFMPVLIMLFCYVSIINTVKRGNALSADGDLTDRQRKIERDVTIVSFLQFHQAQSLQRSAEFNFPCFLIQVSIVICTAFILAWSPYAVVSMWSACGFHVPNLTSIFTRLFAKSASFYNPLIYFGLSSKFRKDVAILLPCTQNPKDTVRLKRFKPKADAHGHRPAGGGARLKVPLNCSEKKYSAMNQTPQATTPDSGREIPQPVIPSTGTTTPDTKEVFFINVSHPSEASSEFECVRL